MKGSRHSIGPGHATLQVAHCSPNVWLFEASQSQRQRPHGVACIMWHGRARGRLPSRRVLGCPLAEAWPGLKVFMDFVARAAPRHAPLARLQGSRLPHCFPSHHLRSSRHGQAHRRRQGQGAPPAWHSKHHCGCRGLLSLDLPVLAFFRGHGQGRADTNNTQNVRVVPSQSPQQLTSAHWSLVPSNSHFAGYLSGKPRLYFPRRPGLAHVGKPWHQGLHHPQQAATIDVWHGEA
jgi:hypothetical protein